MKLRNKKTGEIYELNEFCLYDDKGFAKRPFLESLAELNEEWEDAPEEPKEYWYIAYNGEVGCFEHDDDWQYMDFNWQDKLKQIGNYFETKEEAELAVRKLKAWKRLKDKGFRVTLRGCKGNAWLQANWGNLQGDYLDVLLLFGGEE